MAANAEPSETILIVDDEEPVRKTFREWLEGARLGCRLLSAPDAETALVLANERGVRDWARWGAIRACLCVTSASSGFAQKRCLEPYT